MKKIGRVTRLRIFLGIVDIIPNTNTETISDLTGFSKIRVFKDLQYLKRKRLIDYEMGARVGERNLKDIKLLKSFRESYDMVYIMDIVKYHTCKKEKLTLLLSEIRKNNGIFEIEMIRRIYKTKSVIVEYFLVLYLEHMRYIEYDYVIEKYVDSGNFTRGIKYLLKKTYKDLVSLPTVI